LSEVEGFPERRPAVVVASGGPIDEGTAETDGIDAESPPSGVIRPVGRNEQRATTSPAARWHAGCNAQVE